MKNTILKRLIAVILVILCMTLAFCGCKSGSNYDNSVNRDDFGTTEDVENILDDLNDAYDRKLIRTVNIDAETKNFDTFLTSLEKAISEHNGYIESQSINTGYNDMRYGSITVRIPSDKLDAFVSIVSKSATITSRSSNLQDVTDQYIDIESRLKAYEAEQQALMTMLSQATQIADILEIQGRLSEVTGQIESYKARQKAYDNQVAYSTVTLSVEEVERETRANPGFWQEAGGAIADSFSGLLILLRTLALLFISAIPYLMLIGVMAVIVVVIVRSTAKASKKRKTAEKSDKGDS